jgi:hypothetical protein
MSLGAVFSINRWKKKTKQVISSLMWFSILNVHVCEGSLLTQTLLNCLHTIVLIIPFLLLYSGIPRVRAFCAVHWPCFAYMAWEICSDSALEVATKFCPHQHRDSRDCAYNLPANTISRSPTWDNGFLTVSIVLVRSAKEDRGGDLISPPSTRTYLLPPTPLTLMMKAANPIAT